MPPKYGDSHSSIALKTAIVAITTTTSETAVDVGALGNRMVGSQALCHVMVNTADDGDADETYVLTVEGRDVVGSGTFTTLGTLTVLRGAASVKGHLMNVDEIKNDMRITLTVGGTTPSMIYTAALIALARYQASAQSA